MEKLTRRRAIKLALAAACAANLNKTGNVFGSEQIQPTIFDILGFHGGDLPGSEVDPAKTVKHTKEAGGKWLKLWDPTEDLLAEASKNNLGVIVRANLTQNRLDDKTFSSNADSLRSTVARVSRYYPLPIIQTFNEVMFEHETGIEGGVDPKTHAVEFINAAEIISEEFGGIALFTPLGQNSLVNGLSTMSYYEEFFRNVRRLKPLSWTMNNTALAPNGYFNLLPGDGPLDHIADVLNLADKIFGFKLPAFCTEGGPYQGFGLQYDQEELGNHLTSLIDTPLTPMLTGRLQSFCVWLLESYTNVDDFKNSALTDETGNPKPSLLKIKERGLREDGVRVFPRRFLMPLLTAQS